jgi:hypothetical protein
MKRLRLERFVYIVDVMCISPFACEMGFQSRRQIVGRRSLSLLAAKIFDWQKEPFRGKGRHYEESSICTVRLNARREGIFRLSGVLKAFRNRSGNLPRAAKIHKMVALMTILVRPIGRFRSVQLFKPLEHYR